MGLFPSKGFFFIICNSKGLDQVAGKAFFFQPYSDPDILCGVK